MIHILWFHSNSSKKSKDKSKGLKNFQRHHFSSSLKRMSVVAGYTIGTSTEIQFLVSVKGAPEVLKNMVK